MVNIQILNSLTLTDIIYCYYGYLLPYRTLATIFCFNLRSPERATWPTARQCDLLFADGCKLLTAAAAVEF